MNTMAKMFIFLIFIMSIMFMGLSVVIYSTHTNWKAEAEKLAQERDAAKTLAQQRADQKDELERSFNEELSRRVAEIAKLTTKVEELDKENKEFKDELSLLNEKKEEGIAALKLAHMTMASLRAQNDELSKQLRTSQEEWATMCSNLIAKTDEAHGLALQLATYRSVGEKLAKDYRDAVDVLKKHGLKPVPELYTGVPPKGIQGIVTEVRPNGWIEISIGDDSGVMKGHRLDIVRDRAGRQSYIGKIEIVQTTPDRAVARILPEFRRGTVQRDDKVEYVNVSELTAK